METKIMKGKSFCNLLKFVKHKIGNDNDEIVKFQALDLTHMKSQDKNEELLFLLGQDFPHPTPHKFI